MNTLAEDREWMHFLQNWVLSISGTDELWPQGSKFSSSITTIELCIQSWNGITTQFIVIRTQPLQSQGILFKSQSSSFASESVLLREHSGLEEDIWSPLTSIFPTTIACDKHTFHMHSSTACITSNERENLENVHIGKVPKVFQSFWSFSSSGHREHLCL